MKTRVLSFVCLILLILAAALLGAQTLPPPTPSDQLGFQSMQSYHGGDIDQINLATGNLVVHFPLLSYPQRGKLQVGFNLISNGKAYQIKSLCDPFGGCSNVWRPAGGVSVTVGLNSSTGMSQTMNVVSTTPQCGKYYGSLWKVGTDDGATHIMGNTGSTYSVMSGNCPYSLNGSGPFLALDGSGWRIAGDPTQGAAIIGPDGVRHTTAGEEDANGNQITFSGTNIIDSLNRQIPSPPTPYSTSNASISLCPSGALPVAFAVAWNPPGYNGAAMSYTFCYVTLAVNIPTDPSGDPTGYSRNDPVLQSIVLPNGTAWSFEYNDPGDGSTYNGTPINYGSLTKITLPTGGTLAYTYVDGGNYPTDLGSRWVATRAVNANDGTGAHTWTYNWVGTSPATNTVTDPLGNYVVHTFSTLASGGYTYYETSTKSYQAGGTLLKTVTTDYQYSAGGNQSSGGINGVVPIRHTTTWPSNQVSKVEMDYDAGFTYCDWRTNCAGGNISDIYGKVLHRREYAYGTGAPGALVRTTNTQYQALLNSNYLTNNLLDLVASVQVTDPNATPQQQAYSYNDFDSPSNFQGSGVTTQRNTNPAAGLYRGNITASHRWLNLPTAKYLNTVTSYYDTGEPYQITDPLVHVTTHFYSTNFAGAYPTQIQNPLGQSVYRNYDLNTGVLTSTTDLNGQVTSYSYDSMLRTTNVTHPDQGSTTISYNDAGLYTLRQDRTDKNDASKLTSVYTLFDGLGRETRSAKANDEGTSNIYDQVDTCYDADGRKSFVNYPYQGPGWPANSYFCTNTAHPGDTFAYDGLGRTTSVTHSDGSIASTQYADPATKTTDEGNGSVSVQRISQTDSLGRLVSVCEVSSSLSINLTPGDGTATSCGLQIAGTGFLTTYTYDVLGNLKTVNQGGLPARTFSYDSLSRLLTSFNPEAGTTTYTYDDDGRVATRVRPAPNQANSAVTLMTTYTYDSVDRILTKQYNDSSTPNVAFTYDQTSAFGLTGLTNMIGRTTSEQVINRTSGQVQSAGVYSYDQMGRPIYDYQCTVQSCPSLPTSGMYGLSYTYDLLGNMKTSTNGLTGTNAVTLSSSYNLAGRLVALNSSMSDANHPANLLTGTHYNASGSATSANFGNGAVESEAYYPRGWLQSVNTTAPNPAANTPGTGSVTVNGTEKSVQVGATAGSGSVSLSGVVGRTLSDPNCTSHCTFIFDSGTVTITVNGTNYNATYAQGTTDAALASALTTALNGGTLVTASYTSGSTNATITITGRALGTGSNYSLNAYVVSNDPGDFPSGSFAPTRSGATLTGGTNTTIYDAGSVSVTVNGHADSASYGQGSTPTSIVTALAQAINNDSGATVSATALGATLNLTSKASGSSTNYALTPPPSSSTTQGAYFASPSFSGSPSGATLTGGANGQATVYTLAMSSYAPDGNILAANDSVNGNWSYGYDAFNRLTSASKSGQGFSYVYDRYGNRWQQNVTTGSGPTAVYTFNTNNQISGSGVVYDAAGNVTNDGAGHTFTYDAENRIVSVNGTGATYIYDANGDRVRKISSAGTVDYLYDLAGHVVTELSSTGVWNRGEVFAGGRHLATYTAGTTYFIHGDWLATERARTSVTGPSAETCSSLPFGDAQTCTGSDVSPLHFTGKQRDPETNLDDFGARYFSSTAGRWMSPDWSANAVSVPYANFGKPQSLNLYAYVGNDPVDGEDTDGHQLEYLPSPVQDLETLKTLIDEGTAAGQEMIANAAPAAEAAGSAALSIIGGAIGFYTTAMLNPTSVGQSDADERAAIKQSQQEQGHDKAPEPKADASGAGARKGGDIDRMKQGKPPIGADGHPVELHHPGQSPGTVQEMTRTDHRLGGNYRTNHPEGNKVKSRIDRVEAARQRKEHWQQRARNLEDQ